MIISSQLTLATCKSFLQGCDDIWVVARSKVNILIYTHTNASHVYFCITYYVSDLLYIKSSYVNKPSIENDKAI